WLLKACHNTGVYNNVFTAHTTPHSCPGSSRHTTTLGSTTVCLQLTPPHTPALAPQGMPQHWGLQQCVYSSHHPTLLTWLPKACHNIGVYNNVFTAHTTPHSCPGSPRHATTLGSTTECLQLTPPHTPALAPQGMPQHWGLQQSVYSSHHPTLLPWLLKACHNTGVYNSVFTAHTTPHSCPGSPRHATTLGSTTMYLQLTPPHTPALALQCMPQHWGLQQCVYSSHHPTLLTWLPKACHNTGVYNSVYSSH
ncbi:hypothetical protein LSAT2_013478, partial [Lamellibrachia satsuma]